MLLNPVSLLLSAPSAASILHMNVLMLKRELYFIQHLTVYEQLHQNISRGLLKSHTALGYIIGKPAMKEMKAHLNTQGWVRKCQHLGHGQEAYEEGMGDLMHSGNSV